MIYIRKKLSHDIEIKIDIFGNEFYCKCPECGKETQLDLDTFNQILLNPNSYGFGVWNSDTCCSKECYKKWQEKNFRCVGN